MFLHTVMKIQFNSVYILNSPRTTKVCPVKCFQQLFGLSVCNALSQLNISLTYLFLLFMPNWWINAYLLACVSCKQNFPLLDLFANNVVGFHIKVCASYFFVQVISTLCSQSHICVLWWLSNAFDGLNHCHVDYKTFYYTWWLTSYPFLSKIHLPIYCMNHCDSFILACLLNYRHKICGISCDWKYENFNLVAFETFCIKWM